MSADVLGYLHQKGVQTKQAGMDNVHVACWFCNEPDGKRGRLYINVNPSADIPGLYFCHLCGAKGSLVTIRRHFGDATEKQEREDTGYLRHQILQIAADHYHEALDDHPDVMRYLLRERGLSPETISAQRLGFASGRNTLFKLLRQRNFSSEDIAATGLTTFERDSGAPIDFLRNHITIPYVVFGNVVGIRGRAWDPDDERKYVTGPGQKSRMFNTDSVWEADEIVLCEGEFDCMVLGQNGYKAVAVPGANNWQDNWDDYFKDIRRVWVCFDRDDKEGAAKDVGAKAAAKVLARLGTKARMVELPEHERGKSKNDISEYFVVLGHDRRDFDALIKAARGVLITVQEAIAAHNVMHSLPGLKIGLGRLDEMLKPGLLPSQVAILNANTGAGKTIFLLNLFRWVSLAQPNAKILFLSLEQTADDWWERAKRIHRFFNPGSTDVDAENFWTDRILIDERNRITPDQFIQVLSDFEYEIGKPDLVAVDYLGYWARSFPGERYERTSDAVMMMKEVAKAERIRLVAPNQVSRTTMHGTEPGLQSGRDSGVVEETADFLFSLWRPDTTEGTNIEDQKGRVLLKIQKSRHGGTGWLEELTFAPLSLALVHKDDHVRSTHARQEYHYRNSFAEDWERAQLRHQAGLPQEAPWQMVTQVLDRQRQQSLRVKQ